MYRRSNSAVPPCSRYTFAVTLALLLPLAASCTSSASDLLVPVAEPLSLSADTRRLADQLITLAAQGHHQAIQVRLAAAESALVRSIGTDIATSENITGAIEIEGYPIKSCSKTCANPTIGIVVFAREGKCVIHVGFYDYKRKQSVYLGKRPDPRCTA